MPADVSRDEPDYLTLEKLANEVRHLFGQVVLIHDTNLALMVGVGMGVDDLYYIATPLWPKRRPVWYSAVGACTGLKEYLPSEMYARTENTFALNVETPKDFQMLVSLDDSEPVAYDPDIHPEMRRAIQKLHNEAAVARAQEDDGKLW